MLQRIVTTVAALAILSAAAFALPRPGDPAPPITLKDITNAPPDTPRTLEALRGKVVVLEFWATWCGPCIAAIPHLNELSDHYRDASDVVFLSITKEAPSVVDPFREKREMRSWIGHDDAGDTHDAYGIRFLPTTIVVGKDGRIASVTSPTELTRERIDRFREGGLDEQATFAPAVARMMRNSLEALSKEVTVFSPGLDPFSKLDRDSPNFQVILRENPYASATGGSTTGGLTLMGQPARRVMAHLLQISPSRVLLPEPLASSGARFDLIVTWPGRADPDATTRMAVAGLAASALGCALSVADEEIDGYRIVRVEGGSLPPTDTQIRGFRHSSTWFEAPEGAHLAMLVSALEDVLGKPIANGLGVWEIYRFTRIEFEEGDIDSLNGALRESYGMELVPHRMMSRVARLTPLPD